MWNLDFVVLPVGHYASTLIEEAVKGSVCMSKSKSGDITDNDKCEKQSLNKLPSSPRLTHHGMWKM